jgi:hypothetical protein
MPIYAPQTFNMPPGNLLTTGQETMSREIASATNAAISTGTLRLTHFTGRKTETSTQVRVATGGTAAAATPTLCRIGLYTVATDGAITLVASIANDTTLFAAASTPYVRSWSSSYGMLFGQRYALGVLVVSGAATPTFIGQTVGSATECLVAPALSAQVTGQSDLPSSVATGSVVGSGTRIFGVILP